MQGKGVHNENIGQVDVKQTGTVEHWYWVMGICFNKWETDIAAGLASSLVTAETGATGRKDQTSIDILHDKGQ